MNQNENVIRLAKPRKQGVISLIFSRFFIITLLILIQLAVIILPIILLRPYLHHVFILLGLFTLIMLIYLFNSRMDSTAKMTWMLIISLLQVGGALLLLFTQKNTGSRLLREYSERVISETRDAIPQDPDVLKKLRQVKRSSGRCLMNCPGRKNSSSWSISSLKKAICGERSSRF